MTHQLRIYTSSGVHACVYFCTCTCFGSSYSYNRSCCYAVQFKDCYSQANEGAAAMGPGHGPKR
ncbi:hypothetical protein N7534_007711 [Penicillium rubens]|nr:hypothetical protein N7534_007711 [Penicillium rubens]